MASQSTAGRATVGAIGAGGGWEDLNYAAQRFRAIFEISPTDYRDRYAGRRKGASSHSV